ncbi:FtsK/SpoIIIE domain-containing protein [Phytohabitans suffuscus]|uniref:Cell division protein FtsK n=1 Tax=Phytohabitans suffuscus TaxID=624315 RepID=A0A6F8YES1_9ACTN|nr:FtsK/SpoIIIE domain-containing protein [Phytohabitans suffuscus]BCB84634.1 cell division protein FtsK [Phytohabitans suffuscus]
MASGRHGIVAGVRRDLAAARGLTRAALGAAEAALDEAQRRRDEALARHSERLAALAASREAARREVRAHFERTAGAITEDLAAVAASCAPGAAGASWRAWRPTEPERGRRPGLFRIGTLGQEPAAAAIPALVPLLDLAHLSFTGEPSTVDGVIASLLLRVLGGTRPGEVRLTVYDPEQLGGSLAGFAPLGNADLLTFVGPGGLTGMLDDLVEQIRRINESVLAGEYASLAELTAATAARRPEPWRLVVLLGDAATAADLSSAQRAQLDRIVRTGVACGVHVLARGLPVEAHPTVEHVAVYGSTAACGATGDLPVRLDPPPAAERVAAACRELAELLLAGPPPAQFADLAPEKLWTECSATGLAAPLGDGPDGELVEVPLGDDPPHALIGGPSGSGKTNLIYAWLGSLTARYSPDELALYLLDFKEGVSFARFAPGRRDPSWLPQVRLVGVNVNGDREFGLALLRHLGEELRRRATAAKRHEATKLAELRAEDPSGHWPRIVAVIDEFQVLLAGRDAMATEAVSLLEDLARRGRSQGIHLVLASQDVSGIEALWGRSALIAQFTLRIALPKARRILADTNLAADVIPRFHAVVNADSGVPDANRIVRLPDASDRGSWRALQEKLWHARPEGLEPPRLFDGDAVPPYPADLCVDGAVLGETIDVGSRPAVLRLPRAPGRNLAVLGTRVEEACAVLGAAGRSLATLDGGARFSVVCLDDDASPAAGLLHAALPGARWYDADTAADLLAELAQELDGPLAEAPHYVIGYAWDAAGGQLRHLRTVLARGPERRVHVLGWWRGVTRLRDDLGGVGARFDAIGAWVALDVHGSELSPLSPQPGGPAWYPRPHRALFFDRAIHRAPEVIIPYEVGT